MEWKGKILAGAMHVGAWHGNEIVGQCYACGRFSGHLAQKGKLFDSTMHVGFLGVDGKESFGREIVCWYYVRGRLECEQKGIVG